METKEEDELIRIAYSQEIYDDDKIIREELINKIRKENEENV